MAVRSVLPLPLRMETLPLVSCKRGAKWVKGGGGLGTPQYYQFEAIAMGGNVVF